MNKSSVNIHLILLSILTVVLVINPFYLHQQVNLFEWGLYLPGIDGVLHGKVPYRDFFYLRGPLEVYFPALLMKFFGENAAVLATYFYVGTVLTLLVSVLLAGEVLETRIFWWIFTPVLVARTFPRVVFTYWGGFRYVWGLLAVYCVVRFLKTRKLAWILCAGILTSVSGLTSPEIGISAFVAVASVIIAEAVYSKSYRSLAKTLIFFFIGSLLVKLPIILFLQSKGALTVMLETMWQVATSLTRIFIQIPAPPSTFHEVIAALFNPHNHHFKHLTPAYCYLAFAVYLARQIYIKKVTSLDWASGIIAVYGFMIYVTGFRNIEASVFEMSLQPEKIILFFLLMKVFLQFKERGAKFLAYICVAAVLISSLIFSISHMGKRFFIFQGHKKHKKTVVVENQPSVLLQLPRIRGMVVPRFQADDFTEVKKFLDDHTSANEPVLMFPELGTLSFIAERPYVGRFATVTLSWLKDSWHEEFIKDLKQTHPRYAIVNKVLPDYFKTSYFLVKSNKEKFDEVLSYIQQNYIIVSQTPSYNIYQLK